MASVISGKSNSCIRWRQAVGQFISQGSVRSLAAALVFRSKHAIEAVVTVFFLPVAIRPTWQGIQCAWYPFHAEVSLFGLAHLRHKAWPEIHHETIVVLVKLPRARHEWSVPPFEGAKVSISRLRQVEHCEARVTWRQVVQEWRFALVNCHRIGPSHYEGLKVYLCKICIDLIDARYAWSVPGVALGICDAPLALRQLF